MEAPRILILLGYLVLFSCNTNTNADAEYEEIDSTEVTSAEGIGDMNISNYNATITKFSLLECPAVSKIPSRWEKEWEGDDSVTHNLLKCYNNVNSVETLFKLKVDEYRVIDSKHALCTCPLSINKNQVFSVKYRLKSLGRFNVYYSFDSGLVQNSCDYYCSSLGALVVYDSSSSKANVLPIYFQATPNEPASTYLRLFLIKSYGNIRLYEMTINELSGSLNFLSAIEISIDEMGELVIESDTYK